MKMIALRVDDKMYDMITTLAKYTNNSRAGYAESVMLQEIPKRYNLIPQSFINDNKEELEKNNAL